MIATLWARFQAWLLAAAAAVLAAIGLYVCGRSKGKEAVAQVVAQAQAQQKVNTAQAIQSRTEVRKDVEDATAKLPPNLARSTITVPADLPVAPTPDSSADRLSAEWSRD